MLAWSVNVCKRVSRLRSMGKNTSEGPLKSKCRVYAYKPQSSLLNLLHYFCVSASSESSKMNSMDLEPIITSLLSSFRLVPPAAIPAMLDCILASTNSSPSSLFSSLLNEFANVTKVTSFF